MFYLTKGSFFLNIFKLFNYGKNMEDLMVNIKIFVLRYGWI